VALMWLFSLSTKVWGKETTILHEQ